MEKYALVTGAAGGMGKATVSALLKEGYFVFALDKTMPEERTGVLPIAVDITDSAALASALALVREKTERIDALVHLAGIYMLDSLIEMEESALRALFDVNFFGVFLVNKVFASLLGEGSHILIVTSELATLSPLPFTGCYAISKAALDKYAYSLRMEMQLLGISVSVLRAGAVNTGMLPASTAALSRFTEKTALYSPNARCFENIVARVEARHISPEKLAEKARRILKKRRAKFAYSINRNPLLLLLEALPSAFRFFIIRRILR